MITLALVVVSVLTVAALIGALLLYRRRPGDYELVPNQRTDVEQYTVRTPAGPAVVTKVLDDNGWAYEVRTYFRDEAVRLRYVAPSTVVAQRTLRGLVAEHEGRQVAS